jgi:hypothetical protein
VLVSVFWPLERCFKNGSVGKARLLLGRFLDDSRCGLANVLALAGVLTELRAYVPFGLVILVCG